MLIDRIQTPHAACWPATWPAVVPATGRGLLDSDAAAYIAALVSDGVTVSATQRTALDTFYRTGKSEGWYSSIKRLYLPIWAASGPNARCLVSGTSGTFNGTVDHNSPTGGWVQSDGSTGYLDSGVTPVAAGMTNDSAWGGGLVYVTSVNDQFLGCQASTSEMFVARHAINTVLVGEIMNTSAIGQLDHTVAVCNGILSIGRASGTRYNARRSAEDRTVTTRTDSATGTTPSTLNVWCLAKNNAGSPSAAAGRFGAFWLGTGVSSSVDAAFSTALKNLWETCTGLTLP